MKIDYKKIIPLRYHDVSYETDVPVGVKAIFEDQISKRNGLYVYGPVGSGKTHIACAFIQKLSEMGYPTRFLNTGDFVERLRNEYDAGTEREDGYPGLFRDTMNFQGVLILDDLGAEKMTDWVRERLYLIINKKYEDVIPMIFTSNCDLEILSARLGDRVSSRVCEMAEKIELGGADRRTMQSLNGVNQI